MRAVDVESVRVWAGALPAGTLRRTGRGATFRYEPAFLQRCRERGFGLGFRVPMTEEVVTEGVNLHPYFAGLLPEGARLTALVRAVKTSPDDLFSLLVAAGPETVGDVWVGDAAVAPAVVDAADLASVSFTEVLEASLRYPGAGERWPVPGVQAKVSASRVTVLVGGPRGPAILKLGSKELPHLVRNEAFFMELARGCGLEVAPSRVVADRDGVEGLMVSRFDRLEGRRLHSEDGCQLLDRYPADKYRVSFTEVMDAVRAVVTSPAVELPRLLGLLAFSYVVGNGDLHARNVSVLVRPDGVVRLAPAYDLLTTLPYGDRRLALKVLGRDDNLKRTHLEELARRGGVPPARVLREVDAICDGVAPWISRVADVGFPPRRTAELERVMRKRRDELGRAPRS